MGNLDNKSKLSDLEKAIMKKWLVPVSMHGVASSADLKAHKDNAGIHFKLAAGDNITITEDPDTNTYTVSAAGGGGGGPAAPVPEPLGTTTLLHGHVYTLAVAGDTDLSALGVELYGTAELWLDYTAGSVTWPTGLWWAEGSAPTLEAGKSYAIALRNDGVKLRANVQYEDDTPAQS